MIAATPNVGADVLVGVGGVPEGVTAACAVKAMGGAMLGRLAPQSNAEREAMLAAGLDLNKILTCDEIVTSNEIFLAATGITPGPLLGGVEYRGVEASTYSLLMRGETGTRRMIRAEHSIREEQLDE
jgi:fructose-1,6-bisphosphatase II